MYDNAGKWQSSTARFELSPWRTLYLGAALIVVIMAVIVAVITIAGFAGAAAADAGIISLESLTSLSSIMAVIIVGSAIIAVLLCAIIDKSLVRPLRSMTAAMKELAKGNFDLRIPEHSTLSLSEVDDFAKSFNTAAQELGSTEMMRASFISDFSHEFRTPINALSGFAQLLRDDTCLSSEERREYLDIIIEEAQRLSGLSERILLLSKMEATHLLPDIKTVDVPETIRRAVAIEEARAEERDITFSLTLDPCTCSGNVDYLIQLWTNLINNAVKFSPEGATVSIALYGGRTGEEGRSGTNDELVCWISDEGCGMDATTREHLFDRFYQGDTSHAAEGNGLGLALCKRIVELHHGTISVDSAPGKGSVFEVRLPLSLTAHDES